VRVAAAARAARGKHMRKWHAELEPVLLDMLVMAATDVFFGSPGSTLSHNVCLWRVADACARGGSERSSHCWLTLLSTGTSECDLISCAADADALMEIDADLHPELAINKNQL